jgi:asparagine synthase (glutamine-hydrolysing)
MRSDVPVGLFLSSGIDSGSLLAIMSKCTDTPIRTFTIGFEGGERSNETSDARKMAERFGADHSELIVGPRDYEKYYDRHLRDLEEPVGNETAAAFYFVSMIASRKVKVALSGQGADEPWAGYHRYIGIKLSEIYSRLPSFLTQQVVGRFIERFGKNERLRRGALSLNERDVLTRFVKVYSFYSSGMKERLFNPWLREEISTDGRYAREALRPLQADVQDLDPLTQMLYIDTRASLPDDLLMVADKTSMAHSIEARVPFLDHRLVEMIESLPPKLRLRGFQGKYLHKKAVEKWLPKSVVYRKKKGFANPIDQWLRSGMRHYIGDCLLSETSAVNKYFNKNYIAQMVAEHQASRQEHLRHIYLLIAFELWHQQFIRTPATTVAMQAASIA